MKKKFILAGILVLLGFGTSYSQIEIYEDENPGFWERVYFGGGLNLSFSSFQNVIGASPIVGYMITPRLSAGVGVSYLYVEFKTLGVSSSQFGGNVFARYNIFQPFFLYTEYEIVSWDPNPIDTDDSKEIVPAFYVGAGIYQPFNDRAGLMLIALYDLAHDDDKSLSREPLRIRAGITFSPF